MKNTIAGIQIKFPQVVFFFVVFYLVGIAGILTPFTSPLFLRLIPLALMLSVFGLYLFHAEFNRKTIILYFSIYITAFIFELTGVNTGAIFGMYYYGKSLGFSIMKTPLIIGLNWLLLVYITASVLGKTKLPDLIQVLVASLLMVGYDLILEQVAPLLDMWHWVHETVPLKNYIAWFILAVFFHSLVKIFKLNTENKLAPVILICQALFFIVLYIALKFAN